MASKVKNAKKAKDTKKDNKPSKYNPVRYVKEVINEIKKVTWPTKKELMSYTAAVCAFIACFALIYGMADLGLSKLLSIVVSS